MKIKHIIFCFLFIYAVTVPCAQHNIPQLLNEFNKVSTFKPDTPNDFNEPRAWEIIDIFKKASPTRAPQLELDLRRSLEARSGASRETQTELTRLQKENEQLRNHARHVQEENGRLRSANKGKTTPAGITDQVIKLATELITEVNDLHLDIARAADQLAKNNPSEAQNALNAATDRISTIIPKRNQLETALFAQK